MFAIQRLKNRRAIIKTLKYRTLTNRHAQNNRQTQIEMQRSLAILQTGLITLKGKLQTQIKNESTINLFLQSKYRYPSQLYQATT